MPDSERKQSTDTSVKINIFGHVLKISTYTIAMGIIAFAGWLWKGQTDQDSRIGVVETGQAIQGMEVRYMREDLRLLSRRMGVDPVTPPPATQPGRP